MIDRTWYWNWVTPTSAALNYSKKALETFNCGNMSKVTLEMNDHDQLAIEIS